MARTGLDLISMADIARLAGQSRATVGNWKSRNPDFPPNAAAVPRTALRPGRSHPVARGTNRLDKRPQRSPLCGTSPTSSVAR